MKLIIRNACVEYYHLFQQWISIRNSKIEKNTILALALMSMCSIVWLCDIIVTVCIYVFGVYTSHRVTIWSFLMQASFQIVGVWSHTAGSLSSIPCACVFVHAFLSPTLRVLCYTYMYRIPTMVTQSNSALPLTHRTTWVHLKYRRHTSVFASSELLRKSSHWLHTLQN